VGQDTSTPLGFDLESKLAHGRAVGTPVRSLSKQGFWSILAMKKVTK
jgi:hypothetical protein